MSHIFTMIKGSQGFITAIRHVCFRNKIPHFLLWISCQVSGQNQPFIDQFSYSCENFSCQFILMSRWGQVIDFPLIQSLVKCITVALVNTVYRMGMSSNSSCMFAGMQTHREIVVFDPRSKGALHTVCSLNVGQEETSWIIGSTPVLSQTQCNNP